MFLVLLVASIFIQGTAIFVALSNQRWGEGALLAVPLLFLICAGLIVFPHFRAKEWFEVLCLIPLQLFVTWHALLALLRGDWRTVGLAVGFLVLFGLVGQALHRDLTALQLFRGEHLRKVGEGPRGSRSR